MSASDIRWKPPGIFDQVWVIFFIIVIHLIHFFMIFAWILLENEKCWQQNARCRKKWIMLDVLPNKIFHINWELTNFCARFLGMAV